jgi:hypothetical protein
MRVRVRLRAKDVLHVCPAVPRSLPLHYAELLGGIEEAAEAIDARAEEDIELDHPAD